MARKHPYVRQALAMLGAGAGIWLRSTIDWRAVYADPAADTAHPEHRDRYVYATWHEGLLMPTLLRGGPRMLALASESSDGDIIAQAMRYLGWNMARGSSSRGGVSAMMKYLREDDRHATITVDGPRGPRRVMSMGAIFLASKLNLPVVCVGSGYQRPWRFRSWDRFAMPKPYSRGRAVYGPPMRMPAGLERGDLEGYRLWFENLLNWLTTEAEEWAESGKRRPGESPMLLNEPSAPQLRWNPADAVRIPSAMTEAWRSLPAGQTRERAA